MKTLKTNKEVHIRSGKAKRLANNKKGVVYEGFEVVIDKEIKGESIDGNDIWYLDKNGDFYWSGGFEKSVTKGNPDTLKTNFWWIDELRVNKLWALGLKGKNVNIAVIDSGLQVDHPDISILKKNTTDKSQSDKHGCHDNEGHGTHVSGIINAVHNNIGVYGIAPEAKLFFAKVTNDEWGDDYSLLIDGINWAIDKGVDIISISKGDNLKNDDLEKAIKKAYDASIITICSAGNYFNDSDRSKVMYPAGYSNCIAVGASTKSGIIYPYSSISNGIDLFAPGEEILSTYKESTFKKLSGTSQATPYVSAIAALLIQECKNKNKPYSPESIKKLLRDTASPIPNSTHKIINPVKAYENL